MRIFDRDLAIKSRRDIWKAIDGHMEHVLDGETMLEALHLEQFGILLHAEDFSFSRCRKWTKRDPRMYRREVIVLYGLKRAINVRLTNKAVYSLRGTQCRIHT